MRAARSSFVALSCVAVLTACFGDGQEDAGPSPVAGRSITSTEVACADDIRGTVLGDVGCLLVTVPLVRDASGASTAVDDDGTVRVHVTRLSPPGGSSDRPPILVVPSPTSTPNYLGLSPMAQRTRREVVIVDARGTGHSEPVLSCPEVTRHAAWELRRAPGGALARHRYRAAVAACAARLASEGVSPEAFGTRSMADDLVDVRRALGIDRWAVVAIGSAGRIVPHLMASDGGAVDSVVLDSVELPGLDPAVAAVGLTDEVVEGLLAACADAQPCRAAHPAPRTLWDEALSAVEERPILLRTQRGRIKLDQALLVRVVRAMVSDGGSSGRSFTPGAVPAVLEEVARGGGPLLRREVAPLLPQQDPFCLGFQTDCLLRMETAAGAYLSVMCTERTTEPSTVEDHLEVLTRRLEPAACDRWSTPPQASTTALEWDAPTLVLAGRFAPYGPLADLRALVRSLPAASLVVDPGGADNVMPRTDCLLDLRRSFIDAPHTLGEEPVCVEDLSVDLFEQRD